MTVFHSDLDQKTKKRIIDLYNEISIEVEALYSQLIVEQISYEIDIPFRDVLMAIAEHLQRNMAWNNAEITLKSFMKAWRDTDGLSEDREPQGYVYIFECDGLYKIGKSQSPVARLAAINRSAPPSARQTTLLRQYHVTRPLEIEAKLHKRFSHKSVSENTGGQEWFDLSSDDLEWIDNNVQIAA